MKKRPSVSAFVTILLVVCSFAAPVIAEENATKSECIAKCREAARQIQEIGLEAVLKKISEKNGEFVWKDSYVFCFDDAKILAHPVNFIVGMKTSTIRDTNGVLYMKEMITLAKAKGHGWVNYTYANRKQKTPKPQPKTSYVLYVPEEKVYLGAGIFE